MGAVDTVSKFDTVASDRAVVHEIELHMIAPEAMAILDAYRRQRERLQLELLVAAN